MEVNAIAVDPHAGEGLDEGVEKVETVGRCGMVVDRREDMNPTTHWKHWKSDLISSGDV